MFSRKHQTLFLPPKVSLLEQNKVFLMSSEQQRGIYSPSAIPPDPPVGPHLHGILSGGAPARVPVLPLLPGTGTVAQPGGEDLLGRRQQGVGRGTLPVGDGARDLRRTWTKRPECLCLFV